MFTVNVSFDASTRTLSDDRTVQDYCIGTRGDNNSTKLIFHITDPDHLLDGMVGRVEFDVWIEGSKGEVFKPFIQLDAENSVVLPAEILQGVRRGVLPVQLAFGNDTGEDLYSLNTLMYRIAPAVSSSTSQEDIVPQVLQAYVSMSYDPETKILTFTRINGTTTDVNLESLNGDSFGYEWEGTKLVIKVVDWDGTVISQSDPVDLKGDNLTFSWAGTTLTINQVRNDGHVVDSESRNLKGDDLTFSWNGVYLTVNQVQNDGTVVATGTSNLKGDSVRGDFNDTSLTITNYDRFGQVIGEPQTSNLKGDSLTADFNNTTTLTIKQINVNDPTHPVATTSQNLKGDSLEADFNGTTTLTVKQINVNDPTHPVATTSQNLKGDSLEASFSGTTLTVEQVQNDGTVVDTTSSDLKGDSLEASFNGTTLTIDQVNAAGQTVDSTSSNLKGDSVVPSFSGTTLTVDQVRVDGVVVSSTSSNLKGDSVRGDFNGTNLTITNYDKDGHTIGQPQTSNLKGDSLEASFNGTTTLTVNQVNNAGQTVATTSSDLKGTFLAEWVNNNTSLQITDNSGVKNPVYIRGDDLSAAFDNETLVITRTHNGVVADTVSRWVEGDYIVPTFDGTTLYIYRYHNGQLAGTTSSDLKGERGYPFRIMKIYSSVAAMNADFATCGLQEGELVAIQSNVEDPDNAKLYSKGTTQWEFIVDMSGATGIQGPQGIQGFIGDSLSASFSGTTLTVTTTDHTGATVATTSSNLKGDSVVPSFSGTTLTVNQVNVAGQTVSTTSSNLKGDSCKGEFSGTTLTITNYDKDNVTLSTSSSDLKGDSLEASFSGTTLTISQVNAAGTVIDTDTSNLKGDSLEASFSGTTLTIDQVNAAGTVVDTDSQDLKGDSLEASFSGTTLTIDQVNAAGTTVATTSQDLKGDSLEASFSGTTLTIDQVNAAGTTVATTSSNLKGDSLEASFTNTTLTITQKNAAGTTIDTDSADLKGDSLTASFNGTTTLTVNQVNAAGQTVATTSSNLKGETGDTGYSVQGQLSNGTLTITNYDGNMQVVSQYSENVVGPQGAGVPAGGTTGQLLTKRSDTNYDYKWEDMPDANITSVNGQTGVVVLDANDVGALPDDTTYVSTVNSTSGAVTLKTVNSNSLTGSGDIAVQEVLIGSGTGQNIKTINNTSILGSGNIFIPYITVDTALDDTSTNPVQNQAIAELIPTEASFSNQLADKAFVNSSIASSTATFKGTYNIVDDLGLTAADMSDHSTVATALASTVSSPTVNDYVFVELSASGSTAGQFDRYKYNGTAWLYEYTLNNSSFTADQWAAINSGIDATKVGTYDGYSTTKQDTLVSSGTSQNIKTINGTSLLGQGNISVQATLTFDTAPTDSSTNPVTSGGVYTALGDKLDKVTTSGFERAYGVSSDGQTQKMFNVDLSASSNTMPIRGSNGVLSVGTPTADTHAATKKYVDDGLATKQGTLTFDSAPTENSTNPVTSGGLYTCLTPSVLQRSSTSNGYFVVKDVDLRDGSVDATSYYVLRGNPTSGDAGKVAYIDDNGYVKFSALKTVGGNSLLGTGSALTAGTDYVAHTSSSNKIYGTDGSAADTTYGVINSTAGWTSTTTDTNVPTEKLVKSSLDGKLDKVTSTSSNPRVYGINADGTQAIYNMRTASIAYTIAYRNSNGAISVGTPTADDDATTKKYVDDGLATKLDGFTLDIYNGNSGVNYVKFITVNYSECNSENGVYIITSLQSGHGNGQSYKFLEDVILSVDYLGNISAMAYKYYDTLATGTVHYGDLIWTHDSTNKVVVFYVAMGQYSSLDMIPYRRLNLSQNGTITQHTGTAVLYSAGTTYNGTSVLYTDINNKLDKVTTATTYAQVYAKSTSGNQVMYDMWNATAQPDTIPIRDSSTGAIKTGTPSDNADATTKLYVDTAVAGTVTSFNGSTGAVTYPVIGKTSVNIIEVG